jgi:putative endonuclease
MNKNNARLEAGKLDATFLVNHDPKLVTQNHHCKYSKIDLIMKDAKTLVFIEVRLRSNSQFSCTGASISPLKQQKLILTAQNYLQQLWGFDAFLMDKADTNHIELVRNAFDA